jgi:hypothetical protein
MFRMFLCPHLFHLSAYPALVQTLCELFEVPGRTPATRSSATIPATTAATAESAGSIFGFETGPDSSKQTQQSQPQPQHRERVEEFLMSWNRRIAESSKFFDLMKEAGFTCEHLGKCVYSFRYPSALSP